MRLVQKSLMHTGYIVLKDGSVIPLWGDNAYVEADAIIKSTFMGDYSKVDAIVVTNTQYVRSIIKDIKEYKRVHGIIPQKLMEELRTGFSSDGIVGLRQQKTNLHCYR